jgi:hypothetical protein
MDTQIEKDGHWEIGVVVGVAAVREEPILVNKQTGEITREGGPTVKNPISHFASKLKSWEAERSPRP